MKAKIVILSIFLTNMSLHSQGFASVDWISDTYNSFDVVLSGTGLAGTDNWSTITSPSGLWQLTSFNCIEYPSSSIYGGQSPPGGPYDVFMDNIATATFLGELPAQYDPPPPNYYTYGGGISSSSLSVAGLPNPGLYAPALPLLNEDNFNYGYLAFIWDFGPNPSQNINNGWSGEGILTVTTIPDLNDTSTWTWTSEWYASGPSLQAVPEPSAISVGTMFTLMLAFSTTSKKAKNEVSTIQFQYGKTFAKWRAALTI